MKKSSIKFFTFGIFLLVINTCYCQTEKLSAEKALEKLKSIFDVPSTDGGEPIDIDENFYACIFKYQHIMNLYGFEEEPDPRAGSISRRLPSRQVTYYVAFKGKGLSDWILGIPEPGGRPENIDIRIRKAIYTKEFVAQHKLDKNKVNRVTVFLVPYEKGTENMIGQKAYNLGGLHP